MVQLAGLLYPKLRLRWLPLMLGCSALGAMIAGLYGVIHDEITFSISPEYFTCLKFAQFDYADFGWPARAFVAEVGFLATWWVGFVSGWLLARLAVPRLEARDVLRELIKGFALILGCAAAAFVVGYGLGRVAATRADLSGWRMIAEQIGVEDVKNFMRVAYIHNAGYVGALTGLIIALVRLKGRAVNY